MTTPPPIPVETPQAQDQTNEFVYFKNNYGGYGYSTDMPQEGEYRKIVSKEEYEAWKTSHEEDMWGRQLVNQQMLETQAQAELAEKKRVIKQLADATGMSVEELEKVLL